MSGSIYKCIRVLLSPILLMLLPHIYVRMWKSRFVESYVSEYCHGI